MDVNEYLNLVPTENSQKPKFMAFLEAVLNNGISMGVACNSMGEAFDITNAAGNQLDIIGELVGVSRLLPFVPLLGTREMDDNEYRVFIMMKIFRNEWDGTTESAVKIYQSAFQNIAGIEFRDDGVCHVVVNVRFSGETRLAELLNSTGTLLIPAGVSMTVNVVDNDAIIDFGASANVIGSVTYERAKLISEQV